MAQKGQTYELQPIISNFKPIISKFHTETTFTTEEVKIVKYQLQQI
jgi:hypothetical protein